MKPTDISRRQWLALAGAAAMAPAVPRAVLAADEPAAKIHTRPIPSSGEQIPVVGLGSWQTFDVSAESRALAPLEQVLRRFFSLGGRVIDSSPMYGRSETTIGTLLERIDGVDPFLATKVWTRGRVDGIAQMRASAKKMRGKIDLMQVHNLVDWKTHLKTLRAWKDAGTVRYVGVTHYQLGAFDELAAIMKQHPIDFVQLPYSIGVRRAEQTLLPLAADRGIAVLVMRPFEGGSLFRAAKRKTLPPWAAELGIESWAQYFLKWILGHPAVTCPIPATSDPKHVADNTKAGYGPMPGERQRANMAAYFGR